MLTAAFPVRVTIPTPGDLTSLLGKSIRQAAFQDVLLGFLRRAVRMRRAASAAARLCHIYEPINTAIFADDGVARATVLMGEP
jgi:hypothetical protein